MICGISWIKGVGALIILFIEQWATFLWWNHKPFHKHRTTWYYSYIARGFNILGGSNTYNEMYMYIDHNKILLYFKIFVLNNNTHSSATYWRKNTFNVVYVTKTLYYHDLKRFNCILTNCGTNVFNCYDK